ncbi:unnamed protein product, partial [Allacma fusca]
RQIGIENSSNPTEKVMTKKHWTPGDPVIHASIKPDTAVGVPEVAWGWTMS